MIRTRDALRENLLILLLVIVVVGQSIIGVLMASGEREIVRVQQAQLETQREWSHSVAIIAAWQGPTSLVTRATIDGRDTSLGVQEERGPHDVEAAWDRTSDSLKRLASRKE